MRNRAVRWSSVLGALLLCASAQAQTSHAGHAVSGVSTGLSMSAMNKQMVSALTPLRGRAFDIKFAQLMMNHHQMALDMAGQELSGGKNASVKAQARKVVAAQKKEMALMTAWLRKWTGKVYVPDSMPMMVMGNVNFDRWFLTEMIPHHQGAVDMSKLAPARSGSSEVKKLALSIIKTQSAEINTYKALLKSVK